MTCRVRRVGIKQSKEYATREQPASGNVLLAGTRDVTAATVAEMTKESGRQRSGSEGAPRADSLDLMRRAIEIVARLAPRGEFETATVNALAVALYWRSIGLQSAILLLAESGLVEEGLVLARSMFEDALHLHELHSSESRRAALVLGWLEQSLNHKNGLMRLGASLKIAGDQAPVLARIEKERVQLRGFAAKNRIRKIERFLSVKDAAIKFNRREDYWTYELAHEMTHGSDSAFLHRRKKADSGTVMFHGRTISPKLIASLAAFSLRSLFQGARATVAMLAWDDMGQIAVAEEAVADLDR